MSPVRCVVCKEPVAYDAQQVHHGAQALCAACWPDVLISIEGDPAQGVDAFGRPVARGMRAAVEQWTAALMADKASGRWPVGSPAWDRRVRKIDGGCIRDLFYEMWWKKESD